MKRKRLRRLYTCRLCDSEILLTKGVYEKNHQHELIKHELVTKRCQECGSTDTLDRGWVNASPISRIFKAKIEITEHYGARAYVRDCELKLSQSPVIVNIELLPKKVRGNKLYTFKRLNFSAGKCEFLPNNEFDTEAIRCIDEYCEVEKSDFLALADEEMQIIPDSQSVREHYSTVGHTRITEVQND